MCITLFTLNHPSYALILLSNRDEFLSRPTAPLSWWQRPHTNVLGGRDLQKAEQGTWLGVTKEGRIAVLTNFRDEGVEVLKERSRGGIVNAWLTGSENQDDGTAEGFAKELMRGEGLEGVGGFSLLFGQVAKGVELELSVLSNRTKDPEDLVKIATGDGAVHGLSNSHYGDLSWPKIVHGEQLLKQAVHGSVSRNDSEEVLVEHLFDVLSVDTMPKRQEGEDWTTYARQLRNSIFIPPVGDEVSGAYGTQKQSVVLIDRKGKVTFIERTLYDEEGNRHSTQDAERRFGFDVAMRDG